MNRIVLLVMMVLFQSLTVAGDIVIPAVREGYINPNWELIGKDVIVYKDKPWIKLDTRGNCRYEHEQQCTPLPNGGMNCTMVPKWVCDTDSTLFRLPESVTIQGKEVRYVAEGKDIKIGTMKSFLWFKWVSAENYVGIWTDRREARLILRDQAKVAQEIRFNELHQVESPE